MYSKIKPREENQVIQYHHYINLVTQLRTNINNRRIILLKAKAEEKVITIARQVKSL